MKKKIASDIYLFVFCFFVFSLLLQRMDSYIQLTEEELFSLELGVILTFILHLLYRGTILSAEFTSEIKLSW